ncbi:MAG: XRE family transcriptional regulator [Pseudonocardiaceae bacterium]
MAMENERFRAARERTASPDHPDEGLSRRELAELANAWIWEHHKTMTSLDSNHVGKIERGLVRWPSKLCREAFRAILGAPTDAALGFINPRRAVVKRDNVKRQQFVSATTRLGVGTLVLGPLATLLEGSEPTPIPRRVGATDIEQVRTAARVFTGWEASYGGGFAQDAALVQLHWAAGLLDATCPDQLRPDLFSALGDLAETTGTMAFDAGTHDDARQVFSFALGCAEQAEDWHLRATVLSTMAVQAIRTGRPDEALTLAELALVRADDRLTATERAMLHTDRGRALATMRRVQETLTAIGTADDHFAHSTPAEDPPFMTFWDAAMHAGNTGQALVDLAILGRDPGAATDRLTMAIAGYPPDRVRARVITQAKLASLTMATGDPLHATSFGTQALDTVGTIRSRRALEGLRDLNRHAAAHQNISEVAHLRHQIGTLVLSA